MAECVLPVIAEMMSDGVAVLTESGTLCAANTRLALMLGYESADQMRAELGSAPLFHRKDDRDALGRVVSADEKIERRPSTLTTRRGQPCALSVSAQKRSDGLIDAVFVATGTDAAAELADLHKRLGHVRNHLAQTERIRAVGALSGYLAHELNNVFGSVIGRAQLMQMRTTDERVLRECAYIVQAAEQGVSELKRILHFIYKSRQQMFGPMSVEDVYDEAYSVLQPVIDSMRECGIPVTVEKSFEPHPKIFGYVHEVREIFIHLVRNALEALPHSGGHIAVSCTYGVSDLSLIIRDSGTGIDGAVQAKMFESMFTTKSDQHAGMGLTIVKELLRKMKGSVSFTTGSGEGTCFTVSIPKNDVMPSDTPVHTPMKQIELDQPFVSKILIVDDDEGVLVPLEKLLSSKGFITKALLDSRDAVRTAKLFQPDVVITDLAMPEINGWELAKEMRLMCPTAKIIMTTAYTAMLSDVEMKQTSVDTILQKPVNIQELMNTIMSI